MNKILLIENEDAGKYYQELVQKSLDNINIVWARNRKEALEVVGKDDFKVVVYDQRLDDNELGTDIMLTLKQRDKNLIGIMLSAYATPGDTAKASKDGIMFEYINKDDINVLPSKIVDALRFYDINKALQTSHTKTYIGKVRRKHSLCYPLKYYILTQELIDDNYIIEDSWKDLYIINAGEEQCQKRSIETSYSVKIINNYHNEDQFLTSFSKIERLIGINFQKTVVLSTNKEINDYTTEKEEIEKTYKMPHIPQSVEEDYLTTTILQFGQVYKKYDILILEECTLCNKNTYYHFSVLVPTNRNKLRKVNTYRNGSQEIIEVSPQT